MDRDKELDALLAPLRKPEPGPFLERRWYTAVLRETYRFIPVWLSRAAQLSAALLLGYWIGVSRPDAAPEINGAGDATIETVFTKAE